MNLGQFSAVAPVITTAAAFSGVGTKNSGDGNSCSWPKLASGCIGILLAMRGASRDTFSYDTPLDTGKSQSFSITKRILGIPVQKCSRLEGRILDKSLNSSNLSFAICKVRGSNSMVPMSPSCLILG